RTADADILPFRFDNLAETLGEEVGALKKLVLSRRDHARAVDRLLAERAYRLAADPTQSSGPPEREDVAPDIDFARLDQAVERLRVSAQAYGLAMAHPASQGGMASANAILQGLEQSFMSEAGLPDRPWYRHLLYAPGRLTGYGAKTLPGVREAIESGSWNTAREFVGRTAAALDDSSTKIDQATKALSE
ncbi:MAG TPA: transferrin receptor-like dimerization domain-containing protein, partial [Caulobacteraceae bacterium]